MSDIFVSYASEDRPRVKVLSQALEAQGWSVWWDRSIPFGQRFHQVIERELAAARSVMVIWSERSVGSDWVRAEAGEGMNRGVLVPVTIDDVSPPLVFRQIQTADLAGWEGDQESPVFRKLMADLESLLGAPPDPAVEPLPREVEEPPEPEPLEAPPERSPRRRRAGLPWPWLVAGVLAAGLVALLFWFRFSPSEPDVVERVAIDASFNGSVVMFESVPADLDSGRTGDLVGLVADLMLTESDDNDRVSVKALNGALFEVVKHGRECSALELSRRAFPLVKLQPGLYLCVRTDAGRPSVCRISEIDMRSRAATLDLRCTTR